MIFGLRLGELVLPAHLRGPLVGPPRMGLYTFVLSVSMLRVCGDQRYLHTRPPRRRVGPLRTHKNVCVPRTLGASGYGVGGRDGDGFRPPPPLL